jgi:hypothetical protein
MPGQLSPYKPAVTLAATVAPPPRTPETSPYGCIQANITRLKTKQSHAFSPAASPAPRDAQTLAAPAQGNPPRTTNASWPTVTCRRPPAISSRHTHAWTAAQAELTGATHHTPNAHLPVGTKSPKKATGAPARSPGTTTARNSSASQTRRKPRPCAESAGTSSDASSTPSMMP